MQRDYVEQRDGFYYVAGTRVSLDSIVHAFHDGESPETILQNFDTLTLEQVYGAITFYLANQPAIDRYLQTQQRRVSEMLRAAEPLAAELRSRLEAARKQLHAGTPG
jgi:uncharacterized protein (DUF433 family)